MKRFGGKAQFVCVLAVSGGMALKVGCFGDVGFLGLQDYQRDILVGGLAAAALLNAGEGGEPTGGSPGPRGTDGAPGAPGAAGAAGADEAQGAQGPQGSQGAQGDTGPAGEPGADGARGDDGRDGDAGINCWDLNENGIADDEEDTNEDGAVDALDCRASEFFDIFIDDFFTIPGNPLGELPVQVVKIEEPTLGAPDDNTGETGNIAYRVGIPERYTTGNDVTMRLFFHRPGAEVQGCLVFTLDTLRLRDGGDVEDYGDRLWVRLPGNPKDTVRASALGALLGDGGPPGTGFVIDIPINSIVALNDPDPLAVADLLAFEIATALRADRLATCHDGGRYHLLGVEFFEGHAGTASLSGATILRQAPVECCDSGECPADRTYTINADFDEGTLSGVEHDTVPDQLQLTSESTTLPIMWIANAGEDTVSRWNTDTNKEEARYKTWFGPPGNTGAWGGPAPSRTAVDLEGNCFIANRHFDGLPATVWKILVDGFIDRNGNGVVDTSFDGDSSGTIDVSEMKLMEDLNGNNIVEDNEIMDERIAWVSRVGIAGGTGRSLALDRNGDVYAGIEAEQAYYKVSGVDGSILGGPFSVAGNLPYGAAVDANGILWGAGLFSNNIVKFDTNTNTMLDLFSTSIYGIAIGRDGGGDTRVYAGYNSPYREFDSVAETFSSPAPPVFSTLGISVDGAGNIVVGDSSQGGAAKFAPDGTLIWQAPPQEAGIGEARSAIVDANGDVWTIHLNTSKLAKFSGVDGSPLGVFPSGLNPYTYSDATGLGLRTSFPTGTWTVDFDGLQEDLPWIGSVVSWSSQEPKGSLVTVRVRSSNDQASWSEWVDVTNGVPFFDDIDGQYLQIQVTLQNAGGNDSPILFDLTVEPSCGVVPPQ